MCIFSTWHFECYRKLHRFSSRFSKGILPQNDATFFSILKCFLLKNITRFLIFSQISLMIRLSFFSLIFPIFFFVTFFPQIFVEREMFL